ncbi:RAD51-associated protein 2 [Lissotriton helveticus]
MSLQTFSQQPFDNSELSQLWQMEIEDTGRLTKGDHCSMHLEEEFKKLSIKTESHNLIQHRGFGDWEFVQWFNFARERSAGKTECKSDIPKTAYKTKTIQSSDNLQLTSHLENNFCCEERLSFGNYEINTAHYSASGEKRQHSQTDIIQKCSVARKCKVKGIDHLIKLSIPETIKTIAKCDETEFGDFGTILYNGPQIEFIAQTHGRSKGRTNDKCESINTFCDTMVSSLNLKCIFKDFIYSGFHENLKYIEPNENELETLGKCQHQCICAELSANRCLNLKGKFNLEIPEGIRYCKQQIANIHNQSIAFQCGMAQTLLKLETKQHHFDCHSSMQCKAAQQNLQQFYAKEQNVETNHYIGRPARGFAEFCEMKFTSAIKGVSSISNQDLENAISCFDSEITYAHIASHRNLKRKLQMNINDDWQLKKKRYLEFSIYAESNSIKDNVYNSLCQSFQDPSQKVTCKIGIKCNDHLLSSQAKGEKLKHVCTQNVENLNNANRKYCNAKNVYSDVGYFLSSFYILYLTSDISTDKESIVYKPAAINYVFKNLPAASVVKQGALSTLNKEREKSKSCIEFRLVYLQTTTQKNLKRKLHLNRDINCKRKCFLALSTVADATRPEDKEHGTFSISFVPQCQKVISNTGTKCCELVSPFKTMKEKLKRAVEANKEMLNTNNRSHGKRKKHFLITEHLILPRVYIFDLRKYIFIWYSTNRKPFCNRTYYDQILFMASVSVTSVLPKNLHLQHNIIFEPDCICLPNYEDSCYNAFLTRICNSLKLVKLYTPDSRKIGNINDDYNKQKCLQSDFSVHEYICLANSNHNVHFIRVNTEDFVLNSQFVSIPPCPFTITEDCFDWCTSFSVEKYLTTTNSIDRKQKNNKSALYVICLSNVDVEKELDLISSEMSMMLGSETSVKLNTPRRGKPRVSKENMIVYSEHSGVGINKRKSHKNIFQFTTELPYSPSKLHTCRPCNTSLLMKSEGKKDAKYFHSKKPISFMSDTFEKIDLSSEFTILDKVDFLSEGHFGQCVKVRSVHSTVSNDHSGCDTGLLGTSSRFLPTKTNVPINSKAREIDKHARELRDSDQYLESTGLFVQCPGQGLRRESTKHSASTDRCHDKNVHVSQNVIRKSTITSKCDHFQDSLCENIQQSSTANADLRESVYKIYTTESEVILNKNPTTTLTEWNINSMLYKTVSKHLDMKQSREQVERSKQPVRMNLLTATNNVPETLLEETTVSDRMLITFGSTCKQMLETEFSMLNDAENSIAIKEIPSDDQTKNIFAMKSQFDLVLEELAMFNDISLGQQKETYQEKERNAQYQTKTRNNSDFEPYIKSIAGSCLSENVLQCVSCHTPQNENISNKYLGVYKRKVQTSKEEQEVPDECSYYSTTEDESLYSATNEGSCFSVGIVRVQPLKTCIGPLRIGLSRKAKTKHLHPYLKLDN